MFAYNDNDNMRGGTAEVVSKISGVSVERDDGKHNPFSFSFPSPLFLVLYAPCCHFLFICTSQIPPFPTEVLYLGQTPLVCCPLHLAVTYLSFIANDRPVQPLPTSKRC